MNAKQDKRIAILGTGNIGASIAEGLIHSKAFAPDQITLTRRRTRFLDSFKKRGLVVEQDNVKAVTTSDIIIVAVEPQQINGVLNEIAGSIESDRHIVISVVSGVSVSQINAKLGKSVGIVRAMPNTAIANRESITCLSVAEGGEDLIKPAREIFDTVGKTLVIEEAQMTAATALCACGVAFFLRAIRAASQGGIEIGFQSADALLIASQTAKGAASLLLDSRNHPEHEIDRVTTPRGCTIGGLNQMEHEGFSSAMIKGIITSAEIASSLYTNES